MSLLTQFYPGPGGGGGDGATLAAGAPYAFFTSPSGGNLFYTSQTNVTATQTWLALNPNDIKSTSTTYGVETMESSQCVFNTAGVGTFTLTPTLKNFQFTAIYHAATSATVQFGAGSALTSVTIGYMRINDCIWDFSNCSSLSDVKIGYLLGFSLASVLNMQGCSLTQASVDSILTTAATTKDNAAGTMTIQLNGGTNATPGPNGAAAVTYLTGAGFTVTTN